MKKTTLFALIALGIGQLAHAQQLSSDDPSFQQVSSSKAPTIPSEPAPAAALTVDGTVFPCGGGTDTLVASGACGYLWSSDSLAANVLSTTDSLVFGPIMSDTTVYITSTEAEMDSVVPLPPHSGPFSGNVRGYYFTAPVDFIISGLWVPTDANAGGQNVEVLIFDNQTPPPLWSTTTNAFTSMGYWSNHDPNDTIDVCIAVSAGDVVGIYGNRGADVNSYGTAPYQSMIGGVPTSLTRSGMQQPLASNQMANVFSEANGSISRIEFFYALAPVVNTSAVNITVPYPGSSTTALTICQGDSVYAQGGYQYSTALYYDTLQTVSGCDSIVTTDLTVNAPYFGQETMAICQGDSILLGGSYQTMAGTYSDLYTDQYGCDSTVQTDLTIGALPTVTFTGDTLCTQDGLVAMNGSPAGGSYTGAGVSGNQFDATTAGVGTFSIVYMYADSIGCEGSASADIVVDDCAGIEENTLDGVKVFPNPVTNVIEVVLPENLSTGKAILYDSKGKLVQSWSLHAGTSKLNVESISAGVYVIEINNNGALSSKFRLVKQ